MKTNKQFNLTTCKVVRTAMALLAIVTLSLTAIACKDSAEPETPVAYADFGGTQIPIYAGAGISNETAAAKKSAIDTAYTLLGNADKALLKAKTKKIVIVRGMGYSATKATGVIEFGEDFNQSDIFSTLEDVAAPAFAD